MVGGQHLRDAEGVLPPGCGPAGAAPGAAALPCLNSNNSDKAFPPQARKTAYKLQETLRGLADKYGIDRLGFFTVTFPQRVTAREASRRFNNLNRRVLSQRYEEWVAVFERGGRSRLPHFHLVVVMPGDIRTGCDFEEIERGDYRSANALLRSEWAFWRGITNYDGMRPDAPYSDIGRTELLPVKSTADGIRKYVGKYIEKHMEARLAEDKGVRLLRMSRGASNITTRFSWVSPRATLWRAKLASFAARMGYASPAAFKQQHGPRWAYLLRDVILSEPLPPAMMFGFRRYAGEDGPREEILIQHDDRADVKAYANRQAAALGWPLPYPESGGDYDIEPSRGSGAKRAPASGDGPQSDSGGAASRSNPGTGDRSSVTERRIRAAVERGEVVKLSPFVAIVPGGAIDGR